MTEELKPCPFCGSAGAFENASGSYGYYPAKLRVRCADKGCSGQTGWFQHGEPDYDATPVAKAKAITAWNTRATDAENQRLRAEVEALREDRDAALDALFDAIALIGHAMPMETTALIGGERMVAKNVWQKGHDIMFPSPERHPNDRTD